MKFPSSLGATGDTRPERAATIQIASTQPPSIHKHVHEPSLTITSPRLIQTQAYLCQECDVSIHKMNSIAGNHERRPVGLSLIHI